MKRVDDCRLPGGFGADDVDADTRAAVEPDGFRGGAKGSYRPIVLGPATL